MFETRSTLAVFHPLWTEKQYTRFERVFSSIRSKNFGASLTKFLKRKNSLSLADDQLVRFFSKTMALKSLIRVKVRDVEPFVLCTI